MSADTGSSVIVTLDASDAACVLQAELNIASASDAKALVEAELKLTRKTLEFLSATADLNSHNKRTTPDYTGPYRLGSVLSTKLQFPMTSVPATRLRRFNKPKTLILSYGIRLRVREDMKSLREDCYLEIVRLPISTDIGSVCNTIIQELNQILFWNRFENTDEGPDAAPSELKSLLNLDPGGESVSFRSHEELVALFWDIQKSVDLRQEDTDLFVIRIMHDGHTCLEKLCLEVETFSIWLYALDTSHLPDLKPSSIKPIKIAITNDIELTPGYGSPNFVKYFDRMEAKQSVPPLDQCIVIKNREESIALITPHPLVRNELLFVLRTWLYLQRLRRDALKKMLKIVINEPQID